MSTWARCPHFFTYPLVSNQPEGMLHGHCEKCTTAIHLCIRKLLVINVNKAKRRFLKEKEAKKLLSEFAKTLSTPPRQQLPLKLPIELAEMDETEMFLVDGRVTFVKSKRGVFPTLSAGTLLSWLPKAIVDMGAIPHICNGADIMAPGLVRLEGKFSKGDVVVISDEDHQTPIAVALALYSSKEAGNLESGRVFENIHYVGDKIWSIIKQLNQQR